MSNLLDKASIILTPTAYNNGEALCVKPDDASGDFQFSRNSAATRVNAQGLVEDVQILSSNLVQNGDFSEQGAEEVSNGSFSQQGSELVINGDFATDSDWNKGTGWSISGGVANASAATGLIFQNFTGLIVGKMYKAEVDVKSYTSGGLQLKVGNDSYQAINNSLGIQTLFFTASTTGGAIFVPTSAYTGSIDNVSVVEVGQDWVLSSGWSIADNKAVCDGTQTANSLIYQSGALSSANSFKCEITITNYQSGVLRFVLGGGGSEQSYSANGTYTFYGNKGSDNNLYLSANPDFIGSVTNISVKEVGQNWDLGTGWSIGSSVATKSGTDLSYLTQSSLTSVVGKTYNVKASITNVTTGNIRIDNFTSGTSYTSDTQVNVIYTATTAGAFRFLGWAGFDGTITNISVIEITDDTNLPRINYEGFSYQDALGSELIVNGSFDTDSNWIKGTGWSISDGKAIATNVPNLQRLQNTGNDASVIGKTYKYSISVSNVSGSYSLYVFGAYAFLSVSTEGTIEGYVTATSTNGAIFIAAATVGGLVSASIDNVSVKEYLGQEVVPDSGCGSWLFEPQSTNLITQSELFSDSAWVKSRSTFTDNATQSPSGVNNMGFLTEDTTASNTHYMRGFVTLTDGDNYTLSVFAKAKERNIICLGDNAAAQSNTGVWFDLTNGVVLTQRSGYVGSIKDFGNGIYRCSVTYTASAARQYTDIALSLSDGVNVYTGNGTSGAYFWGAQVEQQSYPTSYIPTDGTQKTRNQDVCTNGGSVSTINSTEGVLYVEIAALADENSFRFISLNDGTQSSDVKLVFYLNNLFAETVVGGVNQGTTSFVFPSITSSNKIAFKYKENNFSLWVNGAEVGTDLVGSVLSPNTLNKLSFNRGDGGLSFFGKTKCVAVWKEALTDTELQELTTI